MSQPYPLDHWRAHAAPIDAPTREAVRAALGVDDRSALPCSGDEYTVWELTGGASHSVFGLEVRGRRYCLKRLRSGREGALGREVGGMCFLARHRVHRAPVPCHWSSSPSYVLTDLVPGQPLGNAALTREQLSGLAEATRELYDIGMTRDDEPLWDID